MRCQYTDWGRQKVGSATGLLCGVSILTGLLYGVSILTGLLYGVSILTGELESWICYCYPCDPSTSV